MIIALFSDTYLPNKNGVATSVAQLYSHLKQLGHHVYVYTIKIPDDAETDSNVIRSASINAHMGVNEGRIAFANIPKISHRLKKDGVQLIHTHTEFTMGLTGRYVARLLNIPQIHTLHTMWDDYTHYFFKGLFFQEDQVAKIFKTFVSRCTAIVTPSAKAAAYINHLGIKGYVVNNGVDQQLFTRSTSNQDKKILRESLNIKEDDVVSLFVGRMAQEKRVIELYRTLKTAMKEVANLKALFIGEGADLALLQQQAMDDGLADRFIFTGFLSYEKIADYYAICQLYVTISLSEVQPMTVIEALISGLPVIARNDLAYTGLVFTARNGYMLASDDEVAEAIITLATNHKQRLDYSNESLVIAKHFSADRQATEMARLYETAIAYGRAQRHSYPIHD